jgi:periplasmic protein TonB
MTSMIGAARVVGVLLLAQVAAATLAHEGWQEARESAQTLPQRIETVPTRPATRPRPSPPSATPKLNQSRIASPKDLRLWAARILDDYPAEALREQWEGTVHVRLRTKVDGMVGKCEVKQSSGYPILDEAACKGMMRFATFNPARDHYGNPAEGEWSTRFTYRIK